MNNINKIVKESGINFSGSLIGSIIGYFWLMVITRALDPAEFGLFSLAQSIINVALVFVLFGTPRALDRFIPLYKTKNEIGKIKQLIFLILQIVLVTSLLIGAILFLTSDVLAISIFNKENLSPILKIMVIAIPLLAFTRIVSFSFIGLKELRYQIYLKQLSEPILKIFFAFLIVIFGFGLITWTWFYIIALFFTAVIAYWIFRKYLLPLFDQVPLARVDFREIISYSWPISIASIVLIIIGQIDFLIIGFYLPSSDIGKFKIYIFLAGFLGLVLSSFARIYKPSISELIPQNKIQDIKDTYNRITKWIFMINSLGLLIIIFFGNELVRLFFTEKYVAAPLTLLILAAGRFINTSFGPEGMTLEAFGKTKLTLINTLLMLICNVILDLLLIPRYGIIGAAIATSATLSLGGLAGLIEIYVIYKMQPYNMNYLKYIFVSILTSGVIFGLMSEIGELSISWIVILIILTIVVYFIGLVSTKSLDDIDKGIIKNIWSRVSRMI